MSESIFKETDKKKMENLQDSCGVFGIWQSSHLFETKCYHGGKSRNLSALYIFFPAPNISPPKANVMLEYDIDEAQALLEKNLSTASRNLETLEDDLDFLRDQFTTTEVSILRLRSPPRLGFLRI